RVTPYFSATFSPVFSPTLNGPISSGCVNGMNVSGGLRGYGSDGLRMSHGCCDIDSHPPVMYASPVPAQMFRAPCVTASRPVAQARITVKPGTSRGMPEDN